MKSNLKQLRKEAGYTLVQLAAATGISKTRLHDLEKDDQSPNLQTACDIAKVLKDKITSIWECK